MAETARADVEDLEPVVRGVDGEKPAAGLRERSDLPALEERVVRRARCRGDRRTDQKAESDETTAEAIRREGGHGRLLAMWITRAPGGLAASVHGNVVVRAMVVPAIRGSDCSSPRGGWNHVSGEIERKIARATRSASTKGRCVRAVPGISRR